jgi:DNA-binding MarR family transcriptional regulator
MVTCTPTKKAYIYRRHKFDNISFTDIAKALDLDRTVVSRNYCKLERQGSNPDFYAKTAKPG